MTMGVLSGRFGRVARQNRLLKEINDAHLKALKADEASILSIMFGKNPEKIKLDQAERIHQLALTGFQSKTLGWQESLDALLSASELVKPKNHKRGEILDSALLVADAIPKRNADARLEAALSIAEAAKPGSKQHKRAIEMAEKAFRKINIYSDPAKYSEIAMTMAQLSPGHFSRARNIDRVLSLNEHVMARSGASVAAEHLRGVTGLSSNILGARRDKCLTKLAGLTDVIEAERGPKAALDHAGRCAEISGPFSKHRLAFTGQLRMIAVDPFVKLTKNERLQVQGYAQDLERWNDRREMAVTKINTLKDRFKGRVFGPIQTSTSQPGQNAESQQGFAASKTSPSTPLLLGFSGSR